jgi:phasin family protein
MDDIGSDTIKTTVEKMAQAGNQAFKDSVEKSLGALNEANALSKGNIEAVVESLTAATKGAETVGAQAMAFSKKNWEDAVAATKTLSSAKSVQEVVELQSKYAKASMEAYVAELNLLTETLSSSFKDTFKPINARMTAAVEKFQSYR